MVRTKQQTKTYWSATRQECLTGVLRAYTEEGRVAQTVRHYYYKLLSYGLLRRNSRYPTSGTNAYKFVVGLLTDARHDGALPYDAVIDPGRRAFAFSPTDSLSAGLSSSAVAVFDPDLWRGQDRRLEVWVEKDAMADFVYSVVGRYRVPVHVCKGHVSVTVVKDAASRYGTGRGWTLLYCGDFDPTGIDIDRFLRDELARHGSHPDIVRVALNQADVALLPAEAALELNDNDSRTPAFVRAYDPGYGPIKFKDHYTGALRGYELDAMPASQLRTRLRDTVLSYIDATEWSAAIKVGNATRLAIAKAMRGVFRGLEEDWLAFGIPDLEDVELETQRRYLLPDGVDYEDYEVDDSDFADDDDDDG